MIIGGTIAGTINSLMSLLLATVGILLVYLHQVLDLS